MGPKLAEVETLYPENMRQIPAMLRQAADSIESETDDDARTIAMVAVQLAEGGQIKVYGWGAVDDTLALGILARGQFEICRIVGGGE